MKNELAPEVTFSHKVEMFNHPRDLSVTVGLDKETGKQAVMITRGPSMKYSPIWFTKGIYESRQAAIEKVREILELVLGKEEKKKRPMRGCLNWKIANQILSDLRADKTAETFPKPVLL